MSEDETQSSIKQHRSHQVNMANQENGKQAPTVQRPANDDTVAWRTYWRAQSQTWRTEPEIDVERQSYLEEHLNIIPDVEKGIYPFKAIKLSRADVEWLLANYGSRHSLASWVNDNHRMPEGLDLRGADLRKANLSGLPLMYIRGGLTVIDRRFATQEQRDKAGVHLEEADLSDSNLMGAHLASSYLERTNFSDSHLENANFNMAHLEGAELVAAHLERASLFRAQLGGANLRRAYFDVGTIFELVTFKDEKGKPAKLADIKWGGVNLAIVDWTQLNILGDELRASEPKLPNGEKKDANRRLVEYERAVRANRQLAVVLQEQGLNEEAMRFSYRAQVLQRKVLFLHALWGQMGLLRERKRMLVQLLQKGADEEQQGVIEELQVELEQLQVRLRQIGLRQHIADLFQRAQKFGQSLFSLFLDLLSGYGYKVGRCFIAYLLVIGVFATIYHLLGTHPTWNESIVISMTAFHGRGFFPEQFHPGDPQALVAAIEAFVGLLIEITLIATLTRRFFGK